MGQIKRRKERERQKNQSYSLWASSVGEKEKKRRRKRIQAHTYQKVSIIPFSLKSTIQEILWEIMVVELKTIIINKVKDLIFILKIFVIWKEKGC